MDSREIFDMKNTLRCCHREWAVCGSVPRPDDTLDHRVLTGPTFPLEGGKQGRI